MLLLVAAAFLALLWLVSSAGSACADNQVNMITPGDGGGGPAPPNTVEGWIHNVTDGFGVPGLRVFLSVDYPAQYDTITDRYGHFVFQSAFIWPNRECFLCVNGGIDGYFLGQRCIDRHWGQWGAKICTGPEGYYCVSIPLEPSAIVEVPAAALYSNTKYASLKYTMGQSSAFSHTMSFHCPIGGISGGYSSAVSVSTTFDCIPLVSYYVKWDHYAPTYWQELYTPGSITAGIGEPEDGNVFPEAKLTSEYIDDTDAQPEYYADVSVPRGIKQTIKFTETGTRTWSLSGGVDFSIRFLAYGLPLNLETTATSTSGVTNTVTITIDRMNDGSGTPLYVTFRIYTPGAPLTVDPGNPGGGGFVGGIEVHVWDISGAG